MTLGQLQLIKDYWRMINATDFGRILLSMRRKRIAKTALERITRNRPLVYLFDMQEKLETDMKEKI